MKKTLSILLAMLSLLSLCACGKTEKDAAIPAAQPAQEKTEKAPTATSTQVKPQPVVEETEPVPEEWAPDGTIKLIISKQANKSAADVLANFISKYSGQKISVVSAADTGDQLKKAQKDGLTLGLISLSQLGFPLEGDSLKSINIKPVCAVSTDPFALAMRENEDRFTSVDELGQFSKDKSEQIRIGIVGEKSVYHAAVQLFSDKTKIRYMAVTKDSLEMLYESLLSGESDLCVARLSELVGQKDIKILTIFSDSRMNYKNVSDIPTLTELGYEDAVMPVDSLCVVLPTGASKEVIAFYEEVTRLALIDPDYTEENNYLFELWHSMSDTNSLAQQWQIFGKEAANALIK